MQGLAHVDNLVLKIVCEHALRNGYASIDRDELHQSEALSSLPQQELADSLDVLESEGLVHVESPEALAILPKSAPMDSSSSQRPTYPTTSPRSKQSRAQS
jgi:hypothetical protein